MHFLREMERQKEEALTKMEEITTQVATKTRVAHMARNPVQPSVRMEVWEALAVS